MQKALLAASRRPGLRRAVTGNPATRKVVDRFVAGETVDDALGAVRSLQGDGIRVTLDHLGEDITTRAEATRTRDAYLTLLDRLAPLGLGPAAEVSMKLSACGQALGLDGHDVALELVRPVVEAASAIGTTVTLDMEDHTTTDSTLHTLRELRADFPWVGGVLQAYLHRTEADCRDLAAAGSRIRLCKGAYKEPASVAFQSRLDVDRSYVRCLRVLMEGDGFPMVATHDPRLVRIACALIDRTDRAKGTYEFQMLYGIRPQEQRRLAAAGNRVRVYTPYGEEWYGYLMRRLAERPSNLTFFLRSLLSQK